MKIEIPVLETERLRLLGLDEARHFEAFAAFWAEPGSEALGGPLDRGEAWRRMAGVLGHWCLRGFGFFAVEEKASGAYVGLAGVIEPEGWPGPELAWSLRRDFRGRGFATEAAARARDHARRDPGLASLISLVSPDNAASEAVALRLGAVPDAEPIRIKGRVARVFRHP